MHKFPFAGDEDAHMVHAAANLEAQQVPWPGIERTHVRCHGDKI